MAETITAVYENGVLRPLQPLNLRERQTVQLQVMPEAPPQDENEAEAAIRRLVEAGLLATRPSTKRSWLTPNNC